VSERRFPFGARTAQKRVTRAAAPPPLTGETAPLPDFVPPSRVLPFAAASEIPVTQPLGGRWPAPTALLPAPDTSRATLPFHRPVAQATPQEATPARARVIAYVAIGVGVLALYSAALVVIATPRSAPRAPVEVTPTATASTSPLVAPVAPVAEVSASVPAPMPSASAPLPSPRPPRMPRPVRNERPASSDVVDPWGNDG